MFWAVIVAQLAERLLPIPEVRVRIQSSVKFKNENVFSLLTVEKTKIQKKEAGNGPSCF